MISTAPHLARRALPSAHCRVVNRLASQLSECSAGVPKRAAARRSRLATGMIASAHRGAIRSAMTSHLPTPQGRSASTQVDSWTNSNCEKIAIATGTDTPSLKRRPGVNHDAIRLTVRRLEPPPGPRVNTFLLLPFCDNTGSTRPVPGPRSGGVTPIR